MDAIVVILGWNGLDDMKNRILQLGNGGEVVSSQFLLHSGE